MALTMRYLACFLVSLLLAGCVPAHKPLSCDELTNLRAQVGKQFTLESLRTWILDTYHVPQETILEEVVPGRAQGYLVLWGERDRTYTVILDQSLVKDVTFTGPQAPVEDVVRCFGLPGLYGAVYKPDTPGAQLGLDLVLPDSGLLTTGARFYRFGSIPSQPPAIPDDFPLTLFRFVTSGTTEDVLHSLFGELPSSDYEHKKKAYRPWPGDWKDLVIEIDPTIGK